MSAMRLPAAFLARDWSYETSYRGMFVLQLLGITGSILIFYAIGTLVAGDQPALQEYGGDYFAFALTGLLISDFFSAGMRSYANRLRLAQTTGTLEAMLVSATPARWIIACSGLWDLALSAARSLIAIAIAVLLAGVAFDVNLTATVLLAVLSLITFISLGMLLAAAIIVVKRGDALVAFANIAITVAAGTFFPIEALPSWIRWVARLLPLHYSLDGLRRATLAGATVNSVATNLVVLAVWAIALTGVAILAIDFAVRRSRADGSLGHY